MASHAAGQEPVTLPQLLLRNAERRPLAVALREKEYGIWQPITWRQYGERVQAFALGLRRMGLGAGDKVAILGDNRPEWLIAELAAQSIGAVSMGVYQDSVAEEVRYLVDWADARVLVVEDQEQVDKVLEIRAGLPKVERVVYYEPRGLRSYRHELLMPFEALEELGREGDAAANTREHAEAVAATRLDDVAIFSTTSGTTGKPKLAMLTHRNLVTMGHSLQQVDPMEPEDDLLSMLPLAWIGEQMTAVSCALLVGFAVNFPERPETVQDNLREIGPQVVFSPPRIWENLVSQVQVRIEDSTWLKRRVFEWSLRAGFELADAMRRSGGPSRSLRARQRLAEWLCFLWLRDQLGLRRIRCAYTGGAALGPDVFRFFHALGVNLKQIYGQTEVSGISVVQRDGDVQYHTVGVPLPGTDLRIADDGEILARSPAVFVGYYRNEEATAEALADGWLHSGDAGYLEEDGHLVVVDRKQDVMTLHDGTRFSPQFLENKLKFSQHVREAVVFGGGAYPFVSALVTIDFGNVGKWAEKRQIAYTTFTDLSQQRSVCELIGAHVERINQDLPAAARIQRFLLLHKELDADDAELTRTRKVRRQAIAGRYRELVEGLYDPQRDSVAIENEITYQDGTTAVLRTDVRIMSVNGPRRNEA
jgi:long-chain acyl-CoA synthetase